MSYVRWHWSIFNVMMRVMGIWFGVGALVGIASGIFYAANPEKVANRPEGPLAAVIACLVLGLLLALFSFTLLRIRSYRPDLRATSNLRSHDGRTAPSSPPSWWTGLPKR